MVGLEQRRRVQYKYYSFRNSITRTSQDERLADRNKPSDTATRHAGEEPGRSRQR
jgi:hypothetical protein